MLRPGTMKTESARPLDAVCALAPSEPQLLCAHRYTLSTEHFFLVALSFCGGASNIAVAAALVGEGFPGQE